jgi:hypothetical protein
LARISIPLKRHITRGYRRVSWTPGLSGSGVQRAPRWGVARAPFSLIRFLAYNPLPPANSWGERLVRHRTTFELPHKEAALEFGVDPSTLAKWERWEREPTDKLLNGVKSFLSNESARHFGARRTA